MDDFSIFVSEKINFVLKSFKTMKSLVFLVLLIFSFNAVAQSIEELELKWKNSSGAEKQNVGLKLSNELLQTNPARAYEICSILIEDNLSSQNAAFANFIAGNAAFNLNNYKASENHLLKGSTLFKELNDEKNVNNINLKLVNLYRIQKNYRKVIEFSLASYNYYISKNNTVQASKLAISIGSNYNHLKDYKSAIEWNKKAIEILDKQDEKLKIQALVNLASVQNNFGDYETALRSLEDARVIAEQNNFQNELREINEKYLVLSENKDIDKQSETEYKSVINQEKTEKINQLERESVKTLEEIEKLNEKMQLAELKLFIKNQEYEKELLKERLEINLLNSKLEKQKLENQNLKLELENQKLINENKTILTQRLVLVILLMFLILLFLTIFYRVMVKTKRRIEEKNTEIENQALELEYNQKEMNRSLDYARSIQKILFPLENTALVDDRKELFAFNKPKTKVSGDFLWSYSNQDLELFVVADCTGHGVPGAFISIIFGNILDEVIKRDKIYEPNLILQECKERLKNKVKDVNNNFKDGMDAAVVGINWSNNEACFSGARKDLFLLRNNEINRYRGDRLPIDTMDIVPDYEYKNIRISFEKNDLIIFGTDGFVDQMGKSGRFGVARFNEMVLSLGKLSNRERLTKVTQTFDEWKGNLEQIDDALIVGLKVS